MDKQIISKCWLLGEKLIRLEVNQKLLIVFAPKSAAINAQTWNKPAVKTPYRKLPEYTATIAPIEAFW